MSDNLALAVQWGYLIKTPFGYMLTPLGAERLRWEAETGYVNPNGA